MKRVLKAGIAERIANDAILFGKVADTLIIQPITLPRLLKINHTKLAHPKVVSLLKRYWSISEENELLAETPETEVA